MNILLMQENPGGFLLLESLTVAHQTFESTNQDRHLPDGDHPSQSHQFVFRVVSVTHTAFQGYLTSRHLGLVLPVATKAAAKRYLLNDAKALK